MFVCDECKRAGGRGGNGGGRGSLGASICYKFHLFATASSLFTKAAAWRRDSRSKVRASQSNCILLGHSNRLLHTIELSQSTTVDLELNLGIDRSSPKVSRIQGLISSLCAPCSVGAMPSFVEIYSCHRTPVVLHNQAFTDWRPARPSSQRPPASTTSPWRGFTFACSSLWRHGSTLSLFLPTPAP